MKYIIAIIVVIIAAFLAIFFIMGGRGGSPEDTRFNLADLADKDTSVTLTIEGNVRGNDTRRAIRITVDSTSRTAYVLSGYNDAVEKSVSFENNMTAYKTFLEALDKLDYTNSKEALYDDPRGVCPFGYIYRYSYKTSDGHKKELWSSSCSIDDGSFYGNGKNIRRLYQAQITDYKEFVEGVKL